MKLKMKLIAAAVALLATSGANAALDNGSGGNGELFLNVWDANGSYTFDLNTTISSFESSIPNSGAINQSYALTNFATFLNGVSDTSALKFNLLANDNSGARRLLTTFTPPPATPAKTSDAIRSANLNIAGFASNVSTAMGTNDNVAVIAASNAYAGQATMGNRISGLLNFDTFGSLANNSYATGLSFMRINAASSGIANSTYTAYDDANVLYAGNVGGTGANTSVRVWIDGTNNLHVAALDGVVAAIPEPETYALMLAGLGMLGFMGRRRFNNRA